MDRIDIPPGSFPLRPATDRDRIAKKTDRRSGRGESERSREGSVRSPFEVSLESESVEVESAGSESERSGFDDNADVHALLDEVHKLGDRMKRDYRLSTVQEYKQAVRSFMRRVAQRGLKLTDHVSGANLLNRKKYALIEVVDSKLERLAIGLVQTQKEQFDLLARIDEINGLLVDLIS